MESAEAEIARLETALAVPGYFNTDGEGFSRDAKALSAAKEKLDALELEWLEIEEMRESLSD